MLVTTRNLDPRAPDLAPALRNGQTLWTFPLQKAQWASNSSNDTDLSYPDIASLEKRIEKVSNDAMSVDRLLRPRSLRPPVRLKFLWEQIKLSMQACNSQPSSKAKKSETELLGRLFSTNRRSTAANNQKCSESSSRSLSPRPLSYSNPCITSVYASHLLRRRDLVPSRVLAKQPTFSAGHVVSLRPSRLLMSVHDLSVLSLPSAFPPDGRVETWSAMEIFKVLYCFVEKLVKKESRKHGANQRMIKTMTDWESSSKTGLARDFLKILFPRQVGFVD